MSLTIAQIKDNIVQLCIYVQDGYEEEDKEYIKEQVRLIRRQLIESKDWIQKTAHLRTKASAALWGLPTSDFEDTRWRINVVDGIFEEALRITSEEREKGTPKPLDTTPTIDDPDLLEGSIVLEGWLDSHGENIIGPSWWMDNHYKDPDSWEPIDLRWLNSTLPKYDGTPVGENHIFRFVGKGSFDYDKWVVSPDGHEYLFGIFTLNRDPKKVHVDEESFDIDLKRWLDIYGEEEHPARMMCVVEGRKLTYALQKQLIELNGTPVGDTHIWQFIGKKNYKRDGKINLFKCVPINLDAV